MMRAAWLWNVCVCGRGLGNLDRLSERLFVQVYQSNTVLLVVVVVVQRWTCCYSFNQNSTYCKNTAYCDGCTGDDYEARYGKHWDGIAGPPRCQRSKKN